MIYMSRGLETLYEIAKKAGHGLVRDFHELEQLQNAPRGHIEFTKAAIDRTLSILKTELGKFRPDCAVLTSAEKLPETECFIIHPMDGKDNFMHGIDCFAINISLVKNKDVLATIIYNPATGDAFFAEKGKGAFKNGARNHVRLRVSSHKDANMVIIASNDKDFICNTKFNWRNSGALSMDLAKIAEGKTDSLVTTNYSVEELIAGAFLVKEAGGVVYNSLQKKKDNDDIFSEKGKIIIGNPNIARKLIDLV